ncbi:DUF1801 domain-containing protein [Leptospira ognonensis]|uniref:DUF1801 domain-containing protein n=2 Tax=Leptospira ognonensis TaxID=2484945 RepID=A0A4R9K4B8_9LEPT|nr:DUF1801 domain-containing protein [Leptospira ognonensis]
MHKQTKMDLQNPMVAEVYFNYPVAIREKLLQLRALVLLVARQTEGVGRIEEGLRWGEPSFLTTESKSGSTIRVHTVKNHPNQYAMYFNCKTDLINRFHQKYPTKLKFSGNRAILFELDEEIPLEIVKECITEALTYNLKKSKK